MSPDLDDRIADVLTAVEEGLESAAAPDQVTGDSLEEVDEEFDLAGHAADAREIVESNEPEAILEAVGLAELPDGSEPSSIPEAIARGPEERVRDLHALVTLASLAEWGEDEADDELEDVLSDLRETFGVDEEREGESDAGEAGATADEDSDGRREEPGDEGSGTDDDEAETEDEGEGVEDESDSTIEDALKRAAGTTVEEFSADLEGLRGRLEALAGDDEVEETDEGEEDGAEEGETAESEAEDEEEGGLFDFGGGRRDGATGSSRMHSTMPSSNRADMRAVRRHSTMPDRH